MAATILFVYNVTQVFAVIVFIAVLVWFSFLSEKKPKKKVLFFGDSITQQGAEAGGYITVLESMLQDHAIKRFVLLASGYAGDTVADLYERMKRDVLGLNPDIVVVFGGVNDAWRKKIAGAATDEVLFQQTIRKIITRLQQQNIRVIICSPAVIGEKRHGENELDEVLDRYRAIIQNIAIEKQVPFIDLRTEFIQYLAQKNKQQFDRGLLTTDGIHLNVSGNELVASLILDTLLGF